MTFTLNIGRTAWTGPVWMVAAGGAFAVANTAVQLASMRFGVPAPTVAFWQYAVAVVLMLPIARGADWRTRHLPMHILRVILAVIGVQAWVAGLAQVPIWQAIALILLSPIFVTLGAAAFLGEQLSRARVLAVMLGAVGGVIILAPWTDSFGSAALLPVLAAVFWAGSSLMTKRLTTTESPGTLTLYLLVLLVPFNLIAAVPAGFMVAGPAIIWIGLAGVCVAVAQYFLARAYCVADAAYLQPFDHIKLPLNVALGLAVFGFAPPGSMWLGAGLILLASGWLLRAET